MYISNLNFVSEKLLDIPNLTIAWERTIRDSNRDVKDYAGIELFEANIDNNISFNRKEDVVNEKSCLSVLLVIN